jgi:predicted RNA methylase
MVMKISQDVLEVLSRCRIDDAGVFLPAALDRKLYLRVDTVLQAIGGKWNRKAKCRVFEHPAADRLDDAIVSGEVDKPADFGYFPTPEPVVKHLLVRADLQVGHTVLEPSAGQGAIADACKRVAFVVMCAELLEANRAVLKKKKHVLIGSDFLQMPFPRDPGRWTQDGFDGNFFDRIVMNPPFAKQADIRHVQHAFKFLRPGRGSKSGGRLVSVMSSGVTFRQDKLSVAFREFVADHGGLVEPLPEHSFRESGTDVNAVVVTLVKP